MTSEQFFELPDPTGNFTYELYFGELVKVGRPKKRHYSLQRLIRDILLRRLNSPRCRRQDFSRYGPRASQHKANTPIDLLP
jgi:hypothetical protein